MNKQSLAQMILEMAEVDQLARNNAKPGKGPANLLIYAIDGVHNVRLHRFVEEFGYPSQNMIGAEAMKAFWLLVQHQDFDLKLQEACLKRCDFAPIEKAHLTDRALVSRGEKQLYGTQFRRKGDAFEPFPIEGPESVDSRREEVGLISLSDEIKKRNRPK